jgi:hypothetical protein
MKKLFRIATMLLIGAGLAACSDSDNSVEDPTTTFANGTAYLNIKIASTDDAGTRADGGGFVYGTEDEQAVSNARFLFYDDNGHFITEAQLWNGGQTNGGSGQNIEYYGNSTLMLTGLTQTNFPTNLVTILNAPTTFAAPSTLDALLAMLAGGYTTKLGDATRFILTTSSYNQGASTRYYVTKLKDTDFKSTQAEATSDTDAVQIYVERLASKVAVGIDTKLAAETGDGVASNVYKLSDFTIVGMEDLTSSTAGTTVYVHFLGWGLEGTAKDSYYLKHLDTGFTTQNFSWDFPNYFRSYWGQAYNYGITDASKVYYPTIYKKGEEAKHTLTYKKASELTKNFTDNNTDYCNENTNSGAVVSQYYPQAITSVLLKAQICDAKGASLGDFVRYNSLYFTASRYIDYVVGALQQQGKLNYKKADGSKLSTADVQLVSDTVNANVKLNGRVIVQLTNGEGWTTNDDAATAVDAATINAELASFNSANQAIGYKDGLMYYNVPIEHLSQKADVSNADGTMTIDEGRYGVLRNHYYQVTITSLSRLGFGIFDPEEPIVPNSDSQKYYHVGARINILSWKTISQSVVL